MSCYNGTLYLPTQLESVLQQSVPVDHVAIVDDASKDDTPQLLASYARTDPRVSVRPLATNGGVNRGFAQALLDCPPSDWYALADQDDFWPADRIERFLREVERLGLPLQDDPTPQLLVCRFASHSGEGIEQPRTSDPGDPLGLLTPGLSWRRTLLAGNPLYGCCFFFNHALKALVDPIPLGKTTHDYWIALLAAYFGQIHIADFIGIHYRQHANNASFGAPSDRYLSKLQHLGRSLRTDLASRRDTLALLDGVLLKSQTRPMDPDGRTLLEQARQAYAGGGTALLAFQLRHRVWRPRLMPNLTRALACLRETVRP